MIGTVLYDMSIERRGTIFTTQHIYRLTKATDATTFYERSDILVPSYISGSSPPDTNTNTNTTTTTATATATTTIKNGKKHNPTKPIVRFLPSIVRFLPSNHQFTKNDIVLLTQQKHGSGDYYTEETLPTHDDAITAEAIVVSTGPTYLDIVMMAGTYEIAFQCLPRNDRSG
jgi:hypothetical protein